MCPEEEQPATGVETGVPKMALLEGNSLASWKPGKGRHSTFITGVVIAGTGQWQKVYRLKGELCTLGLRSWSGLVHPPRFLHMQWQVSLVALVPSSLAAVFPGGQHSGGGCDHLSPAPSGAAQFYVEVW